jgi:hypothetical protein
MLTSPHYKHTFFWEKHLGNLICEHHYPPKPNLEDEKIAMPSYVLGDLL